MNPCQHSAAENSHFRTVTSERQKYFKKGVDTDLNVSYTKQAAARK